MSLPIHLQSIKSSGVYRFVYDKSVISGETAETLRLVVGYSDKGPFNTPVYITSRDEFIQTYGNISKRLEKKGVFFHRLALEALAAGPILAMNLKPFTGSNASAAVKYIGFKSSGESDFLHVFENNVATDTVTVPNLYDTNRFWTLDADKLATSTLANHNYITVAATDSKDASCSIIVRKAQPVEYNLSIREYYAQMNMEMPEYLVPIQDDKLWDYFMDVYVFKGQFTTDLCGVGGPLAKYFNVSENKIRLEENYVDAFGEDADVLAALAADPASNYVAGYRGCTIPYFKNGQGSYVSIDLLFNSGYSAHKMLMKLDESALESDDTVAKLRADLKVAAETTDTVAYYKKTTADNVTGYGNGTTIGTAIAAADVTKKIKATAVEREALPNPNSGVTATDPEYIKINTVAATNVYPCYIEGYEYTTTDWTFANTATNCLGVITDPNYGKGLQEALTNRVDVEYHYIVDTFGTVAGPQGSTDKGILAYIAKKKDNAFAILNFPKVKDFTDSKYKPLGTIDFKEVIKDFPMPDDADGASWVGYFTQIVLSDGTVKTVVPSAGLVSNLFMEKWSSRQPYYIVAGSQYGRLIDSTLVGPDYSFSKTDRDVLEPYGVNVIVYEPRRGTYINSEQTAKQVPVSGLSKIHIRELVIYLQDEIADLLESYRWENNTQVLRDKIKAKADVILETVKNNGGVYDYLNVCDDSNNTPETIDNEFLVLDTHIEPARGAGKMVTQLFIYRTGEMRSTLLQG